jgi:hypothetical protein
MVEKSRVAFNRFQIESVGVKESNPGLVKSEGEG